MSTAASAGGIGRLRRPRAWVGAIPAVVAAGGVGVTALAASGGPRVLAGDAVTGPAAVAEPLALVATGLVVLAWLLAGHVGAFAVGQVALAAVAGTAPLPSLLVAQGGLVALLFGPVVHARRSIRHAVATTVAIAGLATVAAGVWFASGTIWATAGAIAACTAVVAYLFHRWSLLALGVLGDG